MNRPHLSTGSFAICGENLGARILVTNKEEFKNAQNLNTHKDLNTCTAWRTQCCMPPLNLFLVSVQGISSEVQSSPKRGRI